MDSLINGLPNYVYYLIMVGGGISFFAGMAFGNFAPMMAEGRSNWYYAAIFVPSVIGVFGGGFFGMLAHSYIIGIR